MQTPTGSVASQYRRHGFTLVELLVVITIIGILIALLLPAVQAAREAARRMQCANNFKQAGLAMHNYHSVKNCFPPGLFGKVYANPTRYFYFSWSTYTLPYMEFGALYDNINFGAQGSYYDSTRTPGRLSNQQVSGTKVPAYLCPSDPAGGEGICVSPPASGKYEPQCGASNIAGVADSWSWQETSSNTVPLDFPKSDGIMGANVPCTIADVKDGTSNTLMLGETTGGGQGSYVGYFWACWDVADMRNGVNGPYTLPGGASSVSGQNGFSSFHPGGCNFTMGDGSVSFISQNIGQNLLIALTTRDGANVYNSSKPDQVLVSGPP